MSAEITAAAPAAGTGAAPHQPYVPADQNPAELTFRAVILGALLGVVFAASSVYLALKVGMTVSASIPIAVLSITIFRAFGRASILENNLVQTTGSAGESIAAGIAFTVPAYLLLGYDLEVVKILFLSLLGGTLGVLLMIPLRDGLIVREHGKLAYPEGTACADVLIVGEQGGTNARTVFTGFGVGVLYKLLSSGARLWKGEPEHTFGKPFPGATIGGELSPELLGVGYIIGPRVAATMLGGGTLAYLGLIPFIKIFGEGLQAPMFPATKLISRMGPGEIRNAYLLYIGAGAVATGGIISLARSLPTILGAFRRGLSALRASRGAAGAELPPRTARDLPLVVVLAGTAVVALVAWLSPWIGLNPVSAVLVVLFGFFFVTVSSRITGEIGSSSNPISGMTIATLLITCLLFLVVGWTGISYRAMALTTGAIVCVAASVAGATSQDLKTGFLVGATPRSQQLGLFVGVITSALVIGFTMTLLNSAYTTAVPRSYPGELPTDVTSEERKGPDGSSYLVAYQTDSGATLPVGKYLVDPVAHGVAFLVDPGIGGVVSEVDGRKVQKLDAPKGRLMALIIDGILTRKLPWGLVLLGVVIALVLELCGVSSLPFAVGLYLLIGTSTPIAAGGLVRWLVDRRTGSKAAEAEFSPGMLLSSGYIAGGAIAGLGVAILAGAGLDAAIDLSGAVGFVAESDWLGLLPFAVLAWFAYRAGTKPAVAR